MRLLKKGCVLYIVFLSLVSIYFGSVSRVDATPIIKINGTTEAIDQGVGDTNPVSGHVALTGSFSGFNILSVAGATGLDPANAPDLNIGGTIIYSGGGGSLEIAINETGYSATNIQGFSLGGFTLPVLGLLPTVTYEYYIGVDNGVVHNDNDNWATHDLISSFDFNSLSLGDTYALTIVATITTVPGYSFFNFGADVEAISLAAVNAVPEPATVVLIGIGLVGLCGGGYIRRRIKKQSRKV